VFTGMPQRCLQNRAGGPQAIDHERPEDDNVSSGGEELLLQGYTPGLRRRLLCQAASLSEAPWVP
jgi:hypothetical protein